ncbi:MAG: hypothetical protein IK020_04475 [Clostridiales bacterium]|nr:hypothetical protein [Clostridiales bacterium]
MTFTPETTGKYTFMVTDAYDVDVTVQDANGTSILPMKAQKYAWSEIMELQLTAGSTYTFSAEASTYGYNEIPTTCVIFKARNQFSVGHNSVALRLSENANYSFTPSESGAYMFEITGETFKGDSYAYAYMNIYSGKAEISQAIQSSGLKRYYYAVMDAGVTYDLKLYCSGGGEFCGVIDSNISKVDSSLAIGDYEISGGEDYPEKIYSFTPSESGVYVFSSEGSYTPEFYVYDGLGNSLSSTSGGPDGNFRLGVAMEAGETYYLRMKVWSSNTVTFTLKIKKAAALLEDHQCDVNVNPDERVYASFSPATSGYYMITTNADNCSVNSYLSSYYCKNDYESVCYFERGKQYTVSSYNNTTKGYVSFFISKIPTSLSLGENSVTRRADGRYYMTFTPSVSGMYTFTLPSEYGMIDRSVLIGPDNYSIGVLDFDRYNNDYDFNTELVAGKTYLYEVAFTSPGTDPISISIAKKQNPALAIGENPGVFAGEKKYVSFTPGETGMYAFYNFSGADFSVSSEGARCRYYLDGDSYEEQFVLRGYVMTKGQEYTLEPEWTVNGAVDLTVAEVQELSIGSTNIARWGTNTFALFTAPETGIYTFGCEGASVNNVYVVSDKGFETITDRIFKNGKCIAILEKDVTYAVVIYAKSTDISTLPVSVDHMRELEVGTNENVFVEKKINYNDNYTYYTFIPEKSGTYTFHAISPDGIFVRALLYEGMDAYNPVAYGYWHDWDGTMDVYDATLEAGKIYRLAIYTDQKTTDVSVTMTIEQALSYRLAGYSLSLDGSIAVNLYLSLADYVVNSSTAVLKCTFENGSVVNYKVTEATVKNMNNQTYYVFRLPVAAKEMSDSICAQILDTDNGIEGEVYSFSVAEYASAIYNNAYDDDGSVLNQEYAYARPLAIALLNYGTCAQKYFGRHTNDLANWYIDSQDRALSNVDWRSIPKYVADTDSNLPAGLTFYGANLAVESETKLTFYFINETGKTVTFSESTNGISNYSGRTSGVFTTVSVSGIPAHKLGEKIRINITVEGDDTVYYAEYSPLNYCYNVLSRDTNETRTADLKNLMQAFYIYNQATLNYMLYKQN